MKGHSFLEIFFIHLCHRFIRCWGKKRNLKFSVSKQKWGEPTTPWRVYLSLKMLKIKGAVGKERVLVKPRKHLKTWVRGGERQSGWLSSVLEAKPQEPAGPHLPHIHMAQHPPAMYPLEMHKKSPDQSLVSLWFLKLTRSANRVVNTTI